MFYDVYNELGHGFLESRYAEAMDVALESLGLAVSPEVPVPNWFRGKQIGQYLADLVVEGTVILEPKAARTMDKAHEAQLLHDCGQRRLKSGCCSISGYFPQFRRLLFDNERKKDS